MRFVISISQPLSSTKITPAPLDFPVSPLVVKPFFTIFVRKNFIAKDESHSLQSRVSYVRPEEKHIGNTRQKRGRYGDSFVSFCVFCLIFFTSPLSVTTCDAFLWASGRRVSLQVWGSYIQLLFVYTFYEDLNRRDQTTECGGWRTLADCPGGIQKRGVLGGVWQTNCPAARVTFMTLQRNIVNQSAMYSHFLSPFLSSFKFLPSFPLIYVTFIQTAGIETPWVRNFYSWNDEEGRWRNGGRRRN